MRESIKVLLTVVAFGSLVAGASFARSNIALLAAVQSSTAKADFEQAIADTSAMPRHEHMPALLTMIDFYHATGHATGTLRRENTSAGVRMIDFDHAFAAAAMPRPENSPPNRERLRNAGWQQLLASR